MNSDLGEPRGAAIRLQNLTKRFGKAVAVDGISLDIPAGSFVSLLGPSGSGKTTTLNLIAGFLTPDAGDVLFDQRSVADLPPQYRDIGMVFQSYALFPHLTVANNVAFPLRMRTRAGRNEIEKQVSETLALVHMAEYGSRYPRQLSGGQQQRVAMARALVSHPRILLMDEPLGALDKKLREHMQFEIKRIHRSVATTFVYVTHDQSEALSMSDLVVLMHRGRIAQAGSPHALYNEPANVFVADFIGDSNLLHGRIVSTTEETATVQLDLGTTMHIARNTVDAARGRVAIVVRPEDIVLMLPDDARPDGPVVTGRIAEIGFQGDSYRVSVAVGSDVIRLRVPSHRAGAISIGADALLTWDAKAARLLPRDGDPA